MTYLYVVVLLYMTSILERVKSLYAILIASFLILFSGFRSAEVDRDYVNYYNDYYLSIKTIDDGFFVEPLSKSIFLLSSHFSMGIVFAMFLFSFFSILLKLVALKRMGISYSLFFISYFGYFFTQHDMTQVRLALASSLFMISLSYLFESKGKALAFFFGAFLSHMSSIFLLVVVLFRRGVKVAYWTIFLLFSYGMYYLDVDVSSVLLSIIQSVPLFSKYIMYLDGTWKDEGINVFSVTNISFVTVLLVISFFLSIKSEMRDDLLLVTSYKLSILGLALIPILASVPIAAFRISQIYQIFLPILLCLIYKHIKNDVYRLFYIFFLFVFSAAATYVICIHSQILNEYSLIEL
ncbi:TPA: EpsG family protein [Escherichia coli]|uniref:EpsG family protein n=1 Tax=Escherichia coli TaxID=562 RepID=UPI001F38955B|nr:EpsG family protein [Escherichia coli]HEK3906093.1 EpsG family protein [Escherichia coli]